MRVLLDQSLPRPLARLLVGHDARTVTQQNWTSLGNGALLKEAAIEFDVLLTADQNIEFQQNLKILPIAAQFPHNRRYAAGRDRARVRDVNAIRKAVGRDPGQIVEGNGHSLQSGSCLTKYVRGRVTRTATRLPSFIASLRFFRPQPGILLLGQCFRGFPEAFPQVAHGRRVPASALRLRVRHYSY